MTSAEGGGPPPTEGPPPDRREIDLTGPRELPRTRLSLGLDWFVSKVGDVTSWLWVILVLVIVLNVTLRYLFAEGRVELEELQWHLYAVGFLIGLSYCVVQDAHVRVDILYMSFNLRTKAWLELFGILFFLLPFTILVVYYAVPFIERSRDLQEISDAPGGLPFCLALGEDSELCLPMRWHIKLFLLIGFGLLLMATVARLSRVTSHLFGFPRAVTVDRAAGTDLRKGG